MCEHGNRTSVEPGQASYVLNREIVVDYSTYLCAFLRSVHPHHVLSDKLLKELHLGNAEVEIQTACHIHLQRVATHHHLLERDEVQGE